ncbi:MAG: AzlC family ABC transporter permease [Desulfovibrionales bacterium]|nr:AzlC family ABC transporter permease [Desulfovibrionales bacterium]
MSTEACDSSTDPMTALPHTLRYAISDGFRQAVPIIIGFIPVGFTFGVLATKYGLSAFSTIFMSFIVLAGSSQFIAISLFGAAVSPLTIIVTTFIVNLRHLLMSAAIAKQLHPMSPLKKWLFGFQLIDETFAIHMANIERGTFNHPQAFTINCIAHFCWVGGTALGVFGAHLVTDIKPLGFDYALPAMFVALLIWQLRSNMHIIVAAISAVMAVILYLLGAQQLCVILAAVIGATAGVFLCNTRRN